MEDLPRLLEAARAGYRHALGQAFVVAYEQLHFLARNRLRREHVDVVLDATALVHECYLRLMKLRSLKLYDYSHFLGYTGHVMHSIIVDSAHKRLAQRCLNLDTLSSDVECLCTNGPGDCDPSEIEVMLEHLARLDKRLTQVIELKCLHGLTLAEIAQHLRVSERTVSRDWRKVQRLFCTCQHSAVSAGASAGGS